MILTFKKFTNAGTLIEESIEIVEGGTVIFSKRRYSTNILTGVINSGIRKRLIDIGLETWLRKFGKCEITLTKSDLKNLDLVEAIRLYGEIK